MSKILFFLTCRDVTGLEMAIEYGNKSETITICLIQDAVYNANKTNHFIQELIKKGPIYAGKEDIEKRGLQNYLNPEVELLDYSQIIDLILDSDNLINL